MSKIAVVGGGAWGTAIAIVLARNGAHQVRLWAFERNSARRLSVIAKTRCFCPALPFPGRLPRQTLSPMRWKKLLW